MPEVDLSTLAVPELRRLLDAARGRGQATLSYQILQEMAARREGRGARARIPGRKRAEPRVIALNLGDDPLDSWEGPLEPAEPVASEAGPQPEPQPEPEPEPEPAEALYLERDPPPPAAPPRRTRWIGLGLIVGVAVGVPLGLGMGRIIPQPVSPLMVPTENAVSVAAPAPAPVVAPAPPPPPAPIPADPEIAPETPAANAAGPPPSDVAAATPAPAAPTEDAKEDAPPPPAAKRCADAPAPADRAICADHNLQRLQRELRDAYAQALAVHEDRTLLRQHQLAWRADRDGVSDPDRLAQLYEQRIRKLNAATADAKHQR
jgi:uncharacterized protein YecT (DUF1311 family)